MKNIRDQVEFCDSLMMTLKDSVDFHEKYRASHHVASHSNLAQYCSFVKENGATKSQIQADIVRLRRELNSLSRMFD